MNPRHKVELVGPKVAVYEADVLLVALSNGLLQPLGV